MNILVLNGPNLNLLGGREKEHYGSLTLADIEGLLKKLAKELGVKLEFFQSNHEGELVEKIQKAKGKCDGILFNPAAYTHTSVAIRDALIAVKLPFVELHLSNVAGREEFRRRSMVSDLAVGVVSGFGHNSYLLGLRGLVQFLKERG
jgi:3-dehydroquinate dehydratase II